MIAAWRAASLGAPTILLEKNRRLGLKIHISGGGKCNITHGGDMERLRQAFAPHEARFLRYSFRRFTNDDILSLLTRRGVTVHTRPDGRVFPDSGRADDVVDALEWHLRDAGVRLELGVPVERPMMEHGVLAGVTGGGREWRSGAVIVAVGGSSYPKTGTTGDGFRWARKLGHTLAPIRPALAPIYLAGGRRPDYSGVALRDCVLRVRAEAQGGKEISRWRGDLLYTHQGISGPTALGVSRDAALAMETGPVTLDVDLLPDLPFEAMAEAFTAEAAAGGGRVVQSLLRRWVPERLIPELLARAEVEEGTPLHRLPRKVRNRLIETLKRWDLGRVREVPLERGEVVAGGVSLEEVDPGTMRSRRVPNLFLCGEVLDIAGPVGGYNLQAAFSTGYVAGEAAAAAALGSR
jgi:predicted Rossmann fold flavoprotein